MVTQFAMDLFRDPFFIGFNREIERMANVHNAHQSRQTFPPYDVLKLDEDTFQVSLAVAGFSKEDIEISVEDGTLKITGEIVEVTDAEVLHKGIAARKFTRSFALGEYMEVSSASLENGMLIIKVIRDIPEAKKPKMIKIK
jgi:molecular chaperone IbpA